MQVAEFGWTLARWNLVAVIVATILTIAVSGFDPTMAMLG
jgi:hypothetical protein